MRLILETLRYALMMITVDDMCYWNDIVYGQSPFLVISWIKFSYTVESRYLACRSLVEIS